MVSHSSQLSEVTGKLNDLIDDFTTHGQELSSLWADQRAEAVRIGHLTPAENSLAQLANDGQRFVESHQRAMELCRLTQQQAENAEKARDRSDDERRQSAQRVDDALHHANSAAVDARSSASRRADAIARLAQADALIYGERGLHDFTSEIERKVVIKRKLAVMRMVGRAVATQTAELVGEHLAEELIGRTANTPELMLPSGWWDGVRNSVELSKPVVTEQISAMVSRIRRGLGS